MVLLRPSDQIWQASPTPSPTFAASPTPALNQDLLSNRLTVLLLGLDSSEARRANNKGVNSDSIMLASINADQSEVTLISVPRDMANVPLPDGTTWGAKLNGVYAAQGVDGMRGAISELLQVPIDAYVTIDMGDLCRHGQRGRRREVNPHAPLVDEHVHLHMKPGRQQINGENANGYVRTRFDTDYARAARQQEVLPPDRGQAGRIRRPMSTSRNCSAPCTRSTPTCRWPTCATFVELARRAQGADITGQVLNPEDGFILDEGDFGDGRGYILIPDIEKMRRFAHRHLAD